MAERRAPANGIEIVYEEIGDPSDPPLLLVMGLGMQPIHWGPRAVRAAGRPRLPGDPLRHHLGVEAAHVAGASMGGMIAQAMAIRRPDRVLSLTSIMSTTGERRVGRPKLRVWGLLARRAPRDEQAYVEYFVRVFRLIGSKGFPADEDQIRELAAAGYERAHRPAGSARQLAAILASPDRTEALRGIRVPTTVFHGESDPLVPFRAGCATAQAIPDARLIAIPGMGHDLPRPVWPRLVDAIAETAARAAPRQAA